MSRRIRIPVVLLIVLFAASICPAGEIHDAARRGDADAVRAMIQKDPALMTALSDARFTPL